MRIYFLLDQMNFLFNYTLTHAHTPIIPHTHNYTLTLSLSHAKRYSLTKYDYALRRATILSHILLYFFHTHYFTLSQTRLYSLSHTHTVIWPLVHNYTFSGTLRTVLFILKNTLLQASVDVIYLQCACLCLCLCPCVGVAVVVCGGGGGNTRAFPSDPSKPGGS